MSGIGKPHHLVTAERPSTSVCGLVGVAYSTFEPNRVNCTRCLKTLKKKLRNEKRKKR